MADSPADSLPADLPADLPTGRQGRQARPASGQACVARLGTTSALFLKEDD
jgi:hypothetical protein